MKKIYIIAEIGVNYYDISNKNDISVMEAAKLMIDKAAEAGVDAVKFQSYKASKIASKNSPAYWDQNEEPTNSQYELFKKFDSFNYRDYKYLSEYCKSKNIEFLSTPFDFDSADYLYDLMTKYKISSSDLNNLPFIEHIAKKNKPILISTGASNYSEINSAVDTIKKYNDKPLTILHCVLEYPTPYKHANLKRIKTLKEKYPDLIIGYSDHTKPDQHYDVIKTAIFMGATVIEKHFTLDKTLKGNDHYHAMDFEDAKHIVQNINFLHDILEGTNNEYNQSEEIARKNARRSIVSAVFINKGTIITEEMLTYKRPGIGIAPSEYRKVVGKTTKVDIADDTVLEWYMLDSVK